MPVTPVTGSEPRVPVNPTSGLSAAASSSRPGHAVPHVGDVSDLMHTSQQIDSLSSLITPAPTTHSRTPILRPSHQRTSSSLALAAPITHKCTHVSAITSSLSSAALMSLPTLTDASLRTRARKRATAIAVAPPTPGYAHVAHPDVDGISSSQAAANPITSKRARTSAITSLASSPAHTSLEGLADVSLRTPASRASPVVPHSRIAVAHLPSTSGASSSRSINDASVTPVLPSRRRGRTTVANSSLASSSGAPTNAYVDLGSCDQVCEFCHATFWYAERLLSTPRGRRPRYTICCRNGAVKLKYPINPPAEIRRLFQDRNFILSARAYNSMFAMTSFGAKIDKSVNDGKGPPVFKVGGQVSHWIGSLCPDSGTKPSFLQLYIYDTANEVSNRLAHFSEQRRQKLSSATVDVLINVLNRCNSLVRLFRTAKDMCESASTPEFSVRLFYSAGVHPYQLPADGTLGAIVYDNDPTARDFDIIVRTKDGCRQRVNHLHPSYMSLQYPLLFPFGETGWCKELKQRVPPPRAEDLPTSSSTDSPPIETNTRIIIHVTASANYCYYVKCSFRISRDGQRLRRLAVRHVSEIYPVPGLPVTQLSTLYTETEDTLLDQSYLIACSIIKLPLIQEWYKITCVACDAVVNSERQPHRCPTHGDRYLLYRYTVKCTMDDESAKISVLLSDASLITMTGVRCFNLTTIEGFTDVNVLPTPIASLIHTKWLLTVKQGYRITDSLLEFRGTGASPIPIAVVKPGEPVTHDIGTSEDRWEPGIDLGAESDDVSSSQGSHEPGLR